ncbi:MAG: hypothetical protein HY719_03950 [Planctomycetes bacterium]|nr:hypothetical protein [Planctomycetota bacterium]
MRVLTCICPACDSVYAVDAPAGSLDPAARCPKDGRPLTVVVPEDRPPGAPSTDAAGIGGPAAPAPPGGPRHGPPPLPGAPDSAASNQSAAGLEATVRGGVIQDFAPGRAAAPPAAGPDRPPDPFGDPRSLPAVIDGADDIRRHVPERLWGTLIEVETSPGRVEQCPVGSRVHLVRRVRAPAFPDTDEAGPAFAPWAQPPPLAGREETRTLQGDYMVLPPDLVVWWLLHGVTVAGAYVPRLSLHTASAVVRRALGAAMASRETLADNCRVTVRTAEPVLAGGGTQPQLVARIDERTLNRRLAPVERRVTIERCFVGALEVRDLWFQAGLEVRDCVVGGDARIARSPDFDEAPGADRSFAAPVFDGALTLEGVAVAGDLSLAGVAAERMALHGVLVGGRVDLTDAVAPDGLLLSGCRLVGGVDARGARLGLVEMEGCRAVGDVEFAGGSVIASFEVRGCWFGGNLFLTGGAVGGAVRASATTVARILRLSHLTVAGGVSLHSLLVGGHAAASALTAGEPVTLARCQVRGALRLDGARLLGGADFIDLRLLGAADFTGATCFRRFRMARCRVAEAVDFSATEFRGGFDLTADVFERRVIARDARFLASGNLAASTFLKGFSAPGARLESDWAFDQALFLGPVDFSGAHVAPAGAEFSIEDALLAGGLRLASARSHADFRVSGCLLLPPPEGGPAIDFTNAKFTRRVQLPGTAWLGDAALARCSFAELGVTREEILLGESDALALRRFAQRRRARLDDELSGPDGLLTRLALARGPSARPTAPPSSPLLPPAGGPTPGGDGPPPPPPAPSVVEEAQALIREALAETGGAAPDLERTHAFEVRLLAGRWLAAAARRADEARATPGGGSTPPANDTDAAESGEPRPEREVAVSAVAFRLLPLLREVARAEELWSRRHAEATRPWWSAIAEAAAARLLTGLDGFRLNRRRTDAVGTAAPPKGRGWLVKVWEYRAALFPDADAATHGPAGAGAEVAAGTSLAALDVPPAPPARRFWEEAAAAVSDRQREADRLDRARETMLLLRAGWRRAGQRGDADWATRAASALDLRERIDGLRAHGRTATDLILGFDAEPHAARALPAAAAAWVVGIGAPAFLFLAALGVLAVAAWNVLAGALDALPPAALLLAAAGVVLFPLLAGAVRAALPVSRRARAIHDDALAKLARVRRQLAAVQGVAARLRVLLAARPARLALLCAVRAAETLATRLSRVAALSGHWALHAGTGALTSPGRVLWWLAGGALLCALLYGTAFRGDIQPPRSEAAWSREADEPLTRGMAFPLVVSAAAMTFDFADIHFRDARAGVDASADAGVGSPRPASPARTLYRAQRLFGRAGGLLFLLLALRRLLRE